MKKHSDQDGEVKRVREVYQIRDKQTGDARYSSFQADVLQRIHEREEQTVFLLKKAGIQTLADHRILDLGCGRGGESMALTRFGACVTNLHGIDLSLPRLKTGNDSFPAMNFLCGDGRRLPYQDNAFDLIIQNTVFSSVLDVQIQEEIALEMQRVLKPNGLILWYDFHVNNPANQNVRGVKKEQIKKLFGDSAIITRRITLAPPLARKLVAWPFLLHILSSLKIANTHTLALIKSEKRS